jgi:hypothetical protein
MFNTVASPGAIAKVSSPRGPSEKFDRMEMYASGADLQGTNSMIGSDEPGMQTMSEVGDP